MDVVCSRRNNNVNYRVGVVPKEMLPGLSRQLASPQVLSLSVPAGKEGSSALVDIWSYGPADLRARLYDEQGHLVSQGDDRPDDWNFQLTQRLAPGTYKLQVETVGRPSLGKKAGRRIKPEAAEVREEANDGEDVPEVEKLEAQASSDVEEAEAESESTATGETSEEAA